MQRELEFLRGVGLCTVMAVGGDTSILGIFILSYFNCFHLLLDIEDLYNVKTELKEFNKPDWREFGSEAGLSYTTLNGIQDNKTKVEDRFEECLACWLRREDKVDEKGKPSRIRLAEILDEIGDRALAEKIRHKKGKLYLLNHPFYWGEPERAPHRRHEYVCLSVHRYCI